MASFVHQPSLTEGLSLIGWRLKRDAEIQARRNEANFECEVEPSSTSYAAFEHTSSADDNYDPYSRENLDLCLEVDAMNLNPSTDDYDPHEVFMRMNSRRNIAERDHPPLTSSVFVSNYRHYNFADDDTPIKYPLAIGLVDRRSKPTSDRPNPKRVTFRSTVDEDRPSRRFHADNDLDDDIAPTVMEMDMLEDVDENEPITKPFSSLSAAKRSNQLQDEEQDSGRKRLRFDQDDRIPARRGRPPAQEDPWRRHSRTISQFEEQHGLKLGELRVYAPKLRLRISNVNVNWIKLPSIPNFPNKVHQS